MKTKKTTTPVKRLNKEDIERIVSTHVHSFMSHNLHVVDLCLGTNKENMTFYSGEHVIGAEIHQRFGRKLIESIVHATEERLDNISYPLLPDEDEEETPEELEGPVGFPFKAKKPLSMEDIARVASGLYKTTLEDLRSSKRKPTLVNIRHACFYLSRELMGAKYTMIGNFYDRHHSSIIYAIRAAETNEKVQEVIERCRKALKIPKLLEVSK